MTHWTYGRICSGVISAETGMRKKPGATTIPVKKGYVVALTVPTWAPALALGFGDDTSWRASRPKAGCKTTSSQTSQSEIGTAVQYYCLYQTARLTYSATLISTP